jgi:hypothetical protein
VAVTNPCIEAHEPSCSVIQDTALHRSHALPTRQALLWHMIVASARVQSSGLITLLLH